MGKPKKYAASIVKERQALELRKAGHNYARIAEMVGYANESGAFKAVDRALKRTIAMMGESSEDVRQVELERLDTMLVGLWHDAQDGSHVAIDRVLRIMERRSALLGLDAPKKQEFTGRGGGAIEMDIETHATYSVEERDKRILEIIELARARTDFPALPERPDLDSPEGGTNGRVA